MSYLRSLWIMQKFPEHVGFETLLEQCCFQCTFGRNLNIFFLQNINIFSKFPKSLITLTLYSCFIHWIMTSCSKRHQAALASSTTPCFSVKQLKLDFRETLYDFSIFCQTTTNNFRKLHFVLLASLFCVFSAFMVRGAFAELFSLSLSAAQN